MEKKTTSKKDRSFLLRQITLDYGVNFARAKEILQKMQGNPDFEDYLENIAKRPVLMSKDAIRKSLAALKVELADLGICSFLRDSKAGGNFLRITDGKNQINIVLMGLSREYRLYVNGVLLECESKDVLLSILVDVKKWPRMIGSL